MLTQSPSRQQQTLGVWEAITYLKGHFTHDSWAKSRDHESVRAQKQVSKGRPNTPPKSRNVVKDPQVQCDRALDQMLF